MLADEPDDDRPVNGRGRATDQHEPADAPPLAPDRTDPANAPVAICIAVDDFGLHSGINQAALRLASIGRVQAIGCMVGGPAWRGWSTLARRLAPDMVDLGLHLDLTEVPLLERTLRPLDVLIRDSVLRRIDRRGVRAEIRAQLDAFEQTIGRSPTYVDGHQHVHQLPVVRDELLAELLYRYGRPGPWLRSTRSVGLLGARAQLGARAAFKPWVIESLGARGLGRLARRGGWRQNARLLGVYDFTGGPQDYARRLDGWLRIARHGDLLMCHPGLPIATVVDPIGAARSAEYAVLSNPMFETLRRAAGVVLRPMSAILGDRTGAG